MESIKNFNQLTDHLKFDGRRRRIGVVCPYDFHTAEAILPGFDSELMDFTLMGDAQRIKSALPQRMLDSERVTIIDIDDDDRAALHGVRLAVDGEIDVLMKGLINTDNFLRAVLNKELGLLPPGRVLTHLTVAETPAYHKLLFFSDVAVIPYPTLEQRVATINYDLDTCRRFGIRRPKVALIHFTEKVNPKFPNSVDYVKLCEMARKGDFGEVAMAGPMDVKTACDAESASIKGLTSDVSGDADLLIFPNIESGNTFYKTVTLFGGAEVGGILQGTRCPVVLASRSDTARSKYCSLALACIAAGN